MFMVARNNNFDLIRLIAAIQVVVWHAHRHLEIVFPSEFVMRVIKFFPGVPIFFVISGFLLFASFDRNDNLKKYFINRMLRIYPALWICLIITMLSMALFSNVFNNSSSLTVSTWVVQQLTFFQSQIPDSLRYYGTGEPNGSLWTIPVEISFYIFVPIFFYIVRKFKFNITFLLLIFIALSYNFNYYLYMLRQVNIPLFEVLNKNLFSYLMYFLFGSLAYIHWDKIKAFIEEKVIYWLVVYVVYFLTVSVILRGYDQIYWLNPLGFVGMILLAGVVLSAAYTKPMLSSNILKGNDISYGVYLYHMVVINTLIQLGFKGNELSISIVFIGTLSLSYLSWKYIEKPALSLKNKQKYYFLNSLLTLKPK